jgi:glycosyltransferase involved in cell wall biosynthesis
LAKYLPEFGWQPIILTTPIDEAAYTQFRIPKDFKATVRVIETQGYSSSYGKKRLASKKYSKIRPFLKFLYRYYREIAQYPDAEKGWKPFALKAGNDLLQNEAIDAIISSSSPATSHLIAKELKENYKIPWVADFRDLWTQNHNYPYSQLRKFFEEKLELKTLSTADALVTTSRPWADKLEELHGKEPYKITNGFDPDILSDGETNLTTKFTITYTGQIYAGKQDPSKLLIALKDLTSQGLIDTNDVEVRFYGPENELLKKYVEKYGLSNIVKQHGIISWAASFEKQRQSQLLLLLNWDDPREKGTYTGKIFEYLAARRPILATGGFGDDVVKELLEETNSGVYCSTVEEIKIALTELYSEYKLKGRVKPKGNIKKINNYSYREMAKKFTEILNNLTERGQT